MCLFTLVACASESPVSPPPAPLPPPSATPRLIVFSDGPEADPDLWLIKDDGTELRRLTSGPGRDLDPFFDATGTLVYFKRIDPVALRTDIWRVTVADGIEQKVTNYSSSSSMLDFHPTAGIVVRSGGGGIWTVDLEGGNLTRVTLPPAGLSDGAGVWSPDGLELSFHRRITPTDQDLWVVSADGSNLRMVADSSVDTQRIGWHPAGDRLVATLKPGLMGVQGPVFEVQADGSATRKISESASAGDPAWSPDGSRLAFLDRTLAVFKLIIVNADGSDPLIVDAGAQPKWSPDGARLGYCKQIDRITGGIGVANADGSDARMLVLNGGFCEVSHFDW